MILRRRIKKKIEDAHGDQFGFRREKENRDATGMLRLISKQTLEVDGVLCACFTDWQKANECVKWTKLMQILKETGINFHERRYISNFTWIKVLKYD
jgi:hypothetical protein